MFAMERQCGLPRYLRLTYGEQLINNVFYFISSGKKHANIFSQQNFFRILQVRKFYSQVFKVQITLKYPERRAI